MAVGSLLVVTKDVVQAANDKQQITPTLDKFARLSGGLGRFDSLLADTGYFSEANVEACAAAKIGQLGLGLDPHPEPAHFLHRPAGRVAGDSQGLPLVRSCRPDARDGPSDKVPRVKYPRPPLLPEMAWQSFTLPAARLSRHFRGKLFHCRSHTWSVPWIFALRA